MTTRKTGDHQDDLPLASISTHTLFPGRQTLYTHEVARVLSCTERHVINLIEEFELTGGDRGMKGFSIARGADGKVPRGCWRVAVSDFDSYVATHRTSHTL